MTSKAEFIIANKLHFTSLLKIINEYVDTITFHIEKNSDGKYNITSQVTNFSKTMLLTININSDYFEYFQ